MRFHASAAAFIAALIVSAANTMAYVSNSDIAQAAGDVGTAKGKAEAASSRMNVIVKGLRGVFETSPEYIAAHKELGDATDDNDANQKRVMNDLHASQAYLDAQAKRDQAKQTVADDRKNGAAADDIATDAVNALKASQALTAMEASAVENDPAAQAAKKRLKDARDAMLALENKYKLSLAANPDWQKAKDDLDEANGDVTAAQTKLSALQEAKSAQEAAEAANRRPAQAQVQPQAPLSGR